MSRARADTRADQLWRPASPSKGAKRSDTVEIGGHRFVVFAGHGSLNTITDKDHLQIMLPKGMTIVFWVRHGEALADTVGHNVDKRFQLGDLAKRVFNCAKSQASFSLPGMPGDLPEILKGGTVWNYRLTPPSGLSLGNNPINDSRFITNPLKPGMSPSAPVKDRGILLSDLLVKYASLCANATIHWSACRSIVDR